MKQGKSVRRSRFDAPSRSMVRGLAAMLAASLAFGITACAGGGASPEEDEEWNMRVLVGSDFEPLSLAPGRGGAPEIYAIAPDNVFESLVRLTPEGELEGLLAESWELVDDTTWRFHLRPDVEFQDGSTFDAESVRFSYEHIYEEELGSRMTAWFQDVDHVEVIDDLTVDWVTKQPAALLPELVALIPIIPMNLETGDTSTWKGTGPYNLVDVQINSAELEKWDGYWGGETNGPDTVSVSAQSEPAALTASLASGGADLGFPISPDLVDSIPNYAVAPPVQVMSFGLNAFRPPFDNAKVREAVSLGYDIEGNRLALFGDEFSQEAQCQLVPEGREGHAPSVKTPTYDPDRARELVEQAGPEAQALIHVNVAAGRYPNGEQMASLMVEQLNAIGLNAELYVQDGVAQSKSVTNPDKASRPEMWLTSTAWDAGMIYSARALVSPDAIVAAVAHDDYPELWPSFQTALSDTDKEKRAELFDIAAEQLCDSHSMIFAYMPNRIFGLSSDPVDFPLRKDYRIIYADMTR